MILDNLNMQAVTVSQLLGEDFDWRFEIPRFQREYVWTKDQWDNFFSDLTDEDEPGHFFGTIIGIQQENTDKQKSSVIIVIDGQQRLTTLSLYFVALYCHFRPLINLQDFGLINYLVKLMRRITREDSDPQLRLTPQDQNNNKEDYLQILSMAELIPEKYKLTEQTKKRNIYLAFEYFYNKIKSHIEENNTSAPVSILRKLADNANKSIVGVITVKDHLQAFRLFESLNNRGHDLEKTDLIKNFLLAKASTDGKISEYSYSLWKQIIKNTGNKDSEKERFFRNNYNAFRKSYSFSGKENTSEKFANKNNLLDIYTDLTEAMSPKDLLESLRQNSDIYAQITLKPNSTSSLSKALVQSLRNLNEAEGTTSFVLLMHLLKHQNDLQISEDDLISIIQALTFFQIRRNMTKMPPTNRMIPFFNNLVGEVDFGSRVGNSLVNFILAELNKFSAEDDAFEKALRGNVYSSAGTRSTVTLILKMLATKSMTKEKKWDLWEKDDDEKPIWTVEHILPQGKNLRKDWVEMLAEGDAAKAAEIQSQYVHKLGNLTITGYNGNLSNKPFLEKRDLMEGDGKPIGYNNGLSLNSDVCSEEVWNKETIQKRTDRLVEEIVKTFSVQPL